ncbi:glycosyl hydrolase family 17 protein [Labrys neptuniae]|uniref:Endo-1,3-beta-glucanase btgC n=1 Tax=Labrys neptuniae TaxID=376174 RepID=A0ABV3PQA8_9HYPH
MFVCYSPYHRTDSGPPSGVTEADVEADMKIVAAHFTQIRTYGVDGGNQWNADKALKNGIRKMSVGVWVTPNDASATNKQIDLALSQLDAAAKKYGGFEHLDLVIGNEVDRTDVAVYAPADIRNGMAYAKQAVQKYPTLDSVYVTTCFSGTVLGPGPNAAKWQPVVDFCDERTLLTVYPWYGGADPGNIDKQMQWSWDNGLKQVQARKKQIVIAEIGWPSAGGRATSVENERINFETTKKWVNYGNPMGMQFDTYWFEMFDERWKTKEGAQGPHWGLYTGGPNPQPKFAFEG